MQKKINANSPIMANMLYTSLRFKMGQIYTQAVWHFVDLNQTQSLNTKVLTANCWHDCNSFHQFPLSQYAKKVSFHIVPAVSFNY